MQVRSYELIVGIPFTSSVEKSLRAVARIELLNPEDVVRAQLTQSVDLRPRQKEIVLRLPKPFEGVPAAEMEALHWLRVRYEVKSETGEVLASGIEALNTPTTDPFILTAGAARVAEPGRPYRVQVHVRSHNGAPLARVEIHGDLTWDDEGGQEKKLNATALTDAGGNATVQFPIPRDARADNGDLVISVKSGLVARSVDRTVQFHSRSYLMLDTDKDIYQPGQTLHSRMLRFDSERKAVNHEMLDVRIEDEDRQLVFKDTISTDAFGVAHLDWEIPSNLKLGTYVIHAWLSGREDDGRNTQVEKSVHIYRYDLPNFRVEALPDKTYYVSGQNANIAVSAEYLFGKPVTRGKVRVVEEPEHSWNYRKQQWDTEEGQVQTGELDRDGHFTAHFDLSEAHKDLEDESSSKFRDVNVAAYVTDLTTGRTEQRRFELRVTKDPIHVYLNTTPQRNPKLPPTIFVSTFYADGRPARCRLRLSLSDSDEPKSPNKLLRTAETNKYGLAKVSELNIPEDDNRDSLLVEARDAKGLQGNESDSIYDADEDWGTVRVETSHAVYKGGDPVEVTLRSTRADLHLVVQAVREGVVLASQQVRLRNGRGYTTFPYDLRFTDEVAIFAFSLEEEWSWSSMLEGVRTVLFPKNRQLDMAIQLDKNEHRPGEEASARFIVRTADKSSAESALGIKIVDRAVEERSRTDEDFGHRNNWGWWRWSLWSSDSESGFGAMTRDDLDHIDMSQPVPPDLDLVAEYILQSSYDPMLERLEDQLPVGPEQVFYKFVNKQFEPLELGLSRWNTDGKQPHNPAELEALGREQNVDVADLRDPWGTPYRDELSFEGSQQIFTVTSAGPDKRFGTSDDFVAHRTARQYFARYGELIQNASQELMEKQGRFIRDVDTLQAELQKRGVDFKALRDPWGQPYEAHFPIAGSLYLIQICTHGGRSEHRPDTAIILWQAQVDYFLQSRANIDKILTAHLNAGGAYPNDMQSFKGILRESGVDLDELRDPWGHPYYATFQRAAQYSDRIKIQQTSGSGQRISEPVTLIRQIVNVMSVGPDGKPNTPDDFQVANYSILVSEQSASDTAPRPAPAEMSLSENTGAVVGTVFDPTGAVIPNADVQANREGTSESHSVKSDASGKFEMKDLQPGVYDILAHATGFKALEVKSLLVQANSVTEVNFELSVGTTAEMVEVQAAAVSVETTSSSMVEGRSIKNLVTLAPGATNLVTKSGTMSTPRVREDFPETMLWEPSLITDHRGHAKLNFKFADNITTWKLTAVGSTRNGELGRAEQDLRAFQPFFVEHDPPRILTQGDEISYPLVLRNYLDREQTLKASMKVAPWFTLLGPSEQPVKIAAGDAARAVFPYRAVAAVTNGKQQVLAANAEIGDAAEKPVDVHPFGRPISVTAAGILDQKGTLSVTVPQDLLSDSRRARVKIYPNLLAHVVENLEAGLEKPHGCGEQTISSTYPSLLVAEIYASSEPKPGIALKAQRYLAAGYERLLRYQAESGGFSYWGHGETADVALTTYAVEFLHRATKLMNVDEGVAVSAEQWLVQQQRVDGSWRGHWDRNDKDALLLTAYITQTLAELEGHNPAQTEARTKSLQRALTFLAAHRDLADEPYMIASYALAAKATGDQKTFENLLDWLRTNAHQQQDGSYWKLERNTPFYGWGHTGELESTALAVRALGAGHAAGDQTLMRRGLLFLFRNEDKDGMWFSGQTTVNVLKTLLSMVVPRDRESGGSLAVRVNGKEAKIIDLPATQVVVAPIEVDISDQIAAGENQVEFESSTASMISAQLVADGYVPWKEASVTSKSEPNASSVLKYTVDYSNVKGSTSDYVECHVRAERLGYRGYGMMLGEVGLPPGVDVDRESLERAVQGTYAVYRYDVLPDRVILYLWPEAGGSSFSFRFRPRFAMHAETAPSTLYDYYNPEASVTLEPTRFDLSQGKEE